MKIDRYNKAMSWIARKPDPRTKEEKKNEQTATDTELYQSLQNDPARYTKIMSGRYDGNPMPKDYPRKIAVPTRKVTAPASTKNKKIFHGEPIDVESISKDINNLMANSITINPIPVPDLRKKVDPDLLKGVGYLMGSIPENFKNFNTNR